MVPKKIFDVKYTRQSAPEHSSLDEGINAYLPPQEKTMKSIGAVVDGRHKRNKTEKPHFLYTYQDT